MDCDCKARRWMETKLSKYMTNKVKVYLDISLFSRAWIVIVRQEGGWKQMAVCWQWRVGQETHWTHPQIGVAATTDHNSLSRRSHLDLT